LNFSKKFKILKNVGMVKIVQIAKIVQNILIALIFFKRWQRYILIDAS
jgi:hypothetical protein